MRIKQLPILLPKLSVLAHAADTTQLKANILARGKQLDWHVLLHPMLTIMLSCFV
jgi:hypothetical protein